MVPTALPRREDRSVRWCRCACTEPRLSPAPCCSAWRSCSRGRTRWPEWKSQERLCESTDKHLRWLVFNTCLPYLCSDEHHFKEFKLSSTLGFLLPPHTPQQKAGAQSQTWGNTPSAPVHKSSSEPFLSCSVSLQGLQSWGNSVLHCRKASLQLHAVFMLLSFSAFPPLHPWSLYFVSSVAVTPSSNAFPRSLQNVCQKIIGRTSWQEGSSYAQPLPLAGLAAIPQKGAGIHQLSC